jgi:hypothetical protein
MASTPIARMFSAVSRRVSPFTQGGGRRVDRDQFGAELLGRDLEGRAGAGARLEEEVHHRPASSGRVPCPARGRAELVGLAEEQFDLGAGSSSMPVRSFFVQVSCWAMRCGSVALTRLGPWGSGEGRPLVKGGDRARGRARARARTMPSKAKANSLILKPALALAPALTLALLLLTSPTTPAPWRRWRRRPGTSCPCGRQRR